MCFAEVKFIAEQDLQTIDALWKAASGGKFGYSVQREVWLQQSKYWSRFFKKIDWVQVRARGTRLGRALVSSCKRRLACGKFS